jgi:hypothetical protein
MPEVYDEDYSGLLTTVPGLVLKTVIENIRFAFLLLSCFFAHSHSAAADSHQGHMES